MASTDYYVIHVLKFDQYNSKMKGKPVQWLRVDSRMVDSRKYKNLPKSGKLLWIFLLVSAANSSKREVLLDKNTIKTDLHSSQKCIKTALELLVTYEWIRILRTPNERTIRTKRTNERYERGDQISKAPVCDDKKNQKTPPPAIADGPCPIAVYCRVWKARYGTNPPTGGKVAGQLKRLAKDHGAERSENLIKAYLQMPDGWFLTKRHDVSTLLANLNAVAQFLDTGRIVTKNETRQLDAAVTNQNTLDALRRGEL